MKIIIKEEGKKGIRLWLPNRMIFSTTAAKIFARKAREARKKMEIEEEAIHDLIPETVDCQETETMDEAASGKSYGFKDHYLANLPEDKLKEAMKIMRRMKKDHPGVPLVDVEAADGTRVLIQL